CGAAACGIAAHSAESGWASGGCGNGATSSAGQTTCTCGSNAETTQAEVGPMSELLAEPPVEQGGVLGAPYDLTAEQAAGSFGSDDLALAAIALTACRWTAANEVAITITGRSTQRVDAARVVRLRIDDEATVDDFLRVVHTARGEGSSDGPAADGGHVDLVIASDRADLWSGEIRFTTEVPDAAHGFVADVAAAVNQLASRDGSLADVRCIAPERRELLATLIGADVPAVDIHTLFLDQWRRRPRQAGVRDADVELTYEQLSRAADHYCDALRRAGVRPGDKVLVATRRSVGETVALLAITRLGAAYAGMDEDAPLARAKMIIDKLTPTPVVV